MPILVVPDKDLDASSVVLRYRAVDGLRVHRPGDEEGAVGRLRGGDPRVGDGRRAGGISSRPAGPTARSMVGRGTAADPIVVALAGPGAGRRGGRAERRRRRPAAPRQAAVLFAILGGTGFGWASGTGEATRNQVESAGVDWTRAGQLAPEIGYFVTPRFMLGVQGRLQLVTRRDALSRPDPGAGRVRQTTTSARPTRRRLRGAAEGDLVAGRPSSAFQPYLSLSAGGGTSATSQGHGAADACGPRRRAPA